MSYRSVERVIKGKSAIDGAGVKLTRVFGFHDTVDFDPFLMLDAFDSIHPNDYIRGFPSHPHRGIETITYLIEGTIEHKDSLGNKGMISGGGCQWMTAGSGIIHQEMPLPSSRLFGLQLWLNLPKKHKMTIPSYQDIQSDRIPLVETSESRIRIIAGSYAGVLGPARTQYVQMMMLDIEVLPGKVWNFIGNPLETLFVYIIAGSGDFGGGEIHDKHAILFTGGDEISVTSSHEGIRFILVSALPVHEPIAWGGPIVMNQDYELDKAFEEIENGRFISPLPTGKTSSHNSLSDT